MRFMPFSYFLHLLEREAERVPQLLLAHCEHLTPHPHSAANVLVNGVRSLLAHHSTPARDTHLPSCIRHRRSPIGVLRCRRFWTEQIRGPDVADAPICD